MSTCSTSQPVKTSNHEDEGQLPVSTLLQGPVLERAANGVAGHPKGTPNGVGSASGIHSERAMPRDGGDGKGAASASVVFSPLGFDLFGEPIQPETKSPVAQKFLVPPFTILSARDGDWQERKRAWASMGIKGEVGRDAAVIHCPNQASKTTLEDADYTSIFDPVMCEIAYRWFTSEGMQVVDPFAGGSVRGVVASCMGRKYWGGELRTEQVEANREQAVKLCPTNPPQYVCGDSMQTLHAAPEADFIFSCPPYGDLEKYSDDPKDLSAMEWGEFVSAYRTIIHNACLKLKQNRFACFVVGDFRCPKGFYRNFVSETIHGFESCGVRLYNEAILVTSVGSASMRVTKQFEASRKFAKTHQNVLVFCKGDPRKATQDISTQ